VIPVSAFDIADMSSSPMSANDSVKLSTGQAGASLARVVPQPLAGDSADSCRAWSLVRRDRGQMAAGNGGVTCNIAQQQKGWVGEQVWGWAGSSKRRFMYARVKRAGGGSGGL
jgi:hypothetical protein